MDYDVWINKAIMKIGEFKSETKFVLKDLFSGVEWNELERGKRIYLGKVFKRYVENNKIPNIILVESPKGTANTYKKTK